MILRRGQFELTHEGRRGKPLPQIPGDPQYVTACNEEAPYVGN